MMNNKSDYPIVKNLKINDLNTDYKAEIVAHNLIRIYKNIDRVFLKRLGSDKRTRKKDVNKLSYEINDWDETLISIETYRESIYNYLPEGVFHTPSLGAAYHNIDKVISYMQEQKQIKNLARKMFEPFELETYFTELGAYYVENQFEILADAQALTQNISELWPLLQKLDKETVKIFIFLLPFFHLVRGNKKWMEKCLSSFLKLPTTISLHASCSDMDEDIKTEENPEIGVSNVIEGKYEDGEKDWCITIGKIPYEALNNFIPNSDLRKLLHCFYDFCLPLNIKIKEKFITEKLEESFRLSNENNTNILGFSTFL